jgi:hypothetical protein
LGQRHAQFFGGLAHLVFRQIAVPRGDFVE